MQSFDEYLTDIGARALARRDGHEYDTSDPAMKEAYRQDAKTVLDAVFLVTGERDGRRIRAKEES